MIREIYENELTELLELYMHLHEVDVPKMTEHLKSTWSDIINNKNYHIIVKEVDKKIAASCVCVVIPNLTRSVRPYALIENMVTHSEYRGHGYATECLNFAKEIAKSENCYKIMLMTSSKEDSVLNFYKNAGYNCNDKTAFIQWL